MQFACLKQLQDVHVHLHIRHVQKFRVVQQPKRQPQLGQQVREDHVQALAVGQLHDGHVELHVGRAHALPVACVAATQGHFHGVAQVLFGGVAGVGLGQGLAFDQSAHAVDIDNGRDAGDGHKHAPVGLVLEQPVFGQQAKHLAQRVARYLQALAQCRFRQALARRELPVHDLLADQLRHAVIQCLGVAQFGLHAGMVRGKKHRHRAPCGHRQRPSVPARRLLRGASGRGRCPEPPRFVLKPRVFTGGLGASLLGKIYKS